MKSQDPVTLLEQPVPQTCPCPGHAAQGRGSPSPRAGVLGLFPTPALPPLSGGAMGALQEPALPTALEQETWRSCRAGTLRFPLPSRGQPTPHPANSFPRFQSSPSLTAQCRSALARAIGPDACGVRLLQKHPPTGLLPSRKAEPGSRKRLLYLRQGLLLAAWQLATSYMLHQSGELL